MFSLKVPLTGSLVKKHILNFDEKKNSLHSMYIKKAFLTTFLLKQCLMAREKKLKTQDHSVFWSADYLDAHVSH